MEFLIMPFSDDGGIDEGCNYCGQCICNAGSCYNKTGPSICTKCIANCSKDCCIYVLVDRLIYLRNFLLWGRGVARRITM